MPAFAAILLALSTMALLGCAPGDGPSGTATPAPASRASAAASVPSSPGNSNEADTKPEAPAEDADENATEESEDESAKKDEKKKRPERIVLDTVYDDARVGQDQTKLIEAELGVVKDKALNEYVRSISLRLLRHAPARPFDYEFTIVDQTVPNAFALPGGKIYVSRGLLALATSEDELAGVIGHEIAHAAERHAAARQEYNRRLNPLTIGFMRAARIAAYGRDQERDADRGGQIMAARAGYDPNGIANFLRKLDASERYEVGWARLPSFFATHPTSPERSALALERAAQLEWKPVPGVAEEKTKGGPDSFYQMIDGLIIGDDPAGGLFDEENRFIHPELRFTIRFPQGWETMNSQQAVRAVSPMRDAQAELTVAGSAEDPLDKVVDEFIESEFEGISVRVRDRREIKIGELPAIRVEGRAASPIGSLSTQMTFVKYGDLVYRLTMLSISDTGSKYRGRGRAFAHSFRALDDEGVRSLKVTRLRIARALEGETLQELSLRTRNELNVVFTGVLNGRYASTRLAQREPIKIGIAEPYLPRPAEETEGEGKDKNIEGNAAETKDSK